LVAAAADLTVRRRSAHTEEGLGEHYFLPSRNLNWKTLDLIPARQKERLANKKKAGIA
jgi:hypothetical protein